MKKVVVSAPGKIHLMGEHAVVYGKPALLSAIDKRLTITVEETQVNTEQPDFIAQGVELIKQKLHITDERPIHIAITSDIRSGFHLGSSAAVAVALTGAIMKFYTDRFDVQKINDIAYDIEKITHGNPSGGDNTAVTYGGFLWFQKKSETEKIFQQLAFLFPDSFNHFFLINTGKPESTKDMIALVKSNIERQPQTMEQIFRKNEKATMMVKDALETSNERMFIEGIRLGESTLEYMGVVGKTVKPLIRDIEQAGGAAKILGGGGVKDGVGYMLCYHTNKKQIEDIVSSYQYSMESVELGEEGVRIE